MLTFVAEFCFVMSRLKIQVSEAKSRQKKETEKKRENSITILKIFMFSSETVVSSRSENTTPAVVNEPVYSVIYIMQSVLKT